MGHDEIKPLKGEDEKIETKQKERVQICGWQAAHAEVENGRKGKREKKRNPNENETSSRPIIRVPVPHVRVSS
jgi:hypothetical protein